MEDAPSVSQRIGKLPSLSGSVSSLASAASDIERSGRKRVRVDDDPVEHDDFELIRQATGDIRAIMYDEDTGIAADARRRVMDKVNFMEDRMLRLIMKLQKLEGQLLERPTTTQSEPVRSYAGAASFAVPTKPAPKAKPTKTYAVVVRPKDSEGKTSDQVRDEVLKRVKPVLSDVCVKNIRRLRTPGVAIEVATAKDLERFKTCEVFNAFGLTVADPKKIGPRCIIFDVDRDEKDEDLLKEIYSKNISLVCPISEFLSGTRICTRLKQKEGNLDNLIVEMPTRVFDYLIERGRLYVGWRSLRIKRYDSVNRCYRCLGFNHRAAECKVADMICKKCGGPGHIAVECKVSEVSCRNCKLKNKEDKHSIMSAQCPDYIRELERVRNRTTNG